MRFCGSVVDLQLGRVTEEAELAAHAIAWQPSVLVKQDMDACSSCGPVDPRKRSPATAGRCTGLPRPCSKVPLAFASPFRGTATRVEPAGVTDSPVAFVRLLEEYQVSNGRVAWYTSQVCRSAGEGSLELRTHLLLTCGSRPDHGIRRLSVERYSVSSRSLQTGHPASIGESSM